MAPWSAQRPVAPARNEAPRTCRRRARAQRSRGTCSSSVASLFTTHTARGLRPRTRIAWPSVAQVHGCKRPLLLLLCDAHCPALPLIAVGAHQVRTGRSSHQMGPRCRPHKCDAVRVPAPPARPPRRLLARHERHLAVSGWHRRQRGAALWQDARQHHPRPLPARELPERHRRDAQGEYRRTSALGRKRAVCNGRCNSRMAVRV